MVNRTLHTNITFSLADFERLASQNVNLVSELKKKQLEYILDLADEEGELSQLGYTQFRGKHVAEYAQAIVDTKYQSLILKAIQGLKSSFVFKPVEPESESEVDYYSFDLPQKDVSVNDRVAIMIQRDDKLHWIGIGRVDRTLGMDEYQSIRDKRDYFVVAVEALFVKYIDPFTSSPVEPGSNIPWRRSLLYSLKDFLNVTRKPTDYEDVNDFLRSQPKSTKKRKQIEIIDSDSGEEEEQKSKHQRLNSNDRNSSGSSQESIVSQLLPAASQVGPNEPVVDPQQSNSEPDYREMREMIRRSMDFLVPLIESLRKFCDPVAVTNRSGNKEELNLGHQVYYPTEFKNEDDTQMDKVNDDQNAQLGK